LAPDGHGCGSRLVSAGEQPLTEATVPHLLIALAVPFLAWLAYLGCCLLLVKMTGKSESLKDLAVAARAFPLVPRLPQALARRREPPG
jgi:hypothetical protein